MNLTLKIDTIWFIQRNVVQMLYKTFQNDGKDTFPASTASTNNIDRCRLINVIVLIQYADKVKSFEALEVSSSL